MFDVVGAPIPNATDPFLARANTSIASAYIHLAHLLPSHETLFSLALKGKLSKEKTEEYHREAMTLL